MRQKPEILGTNTIAESQLFRIEQIELQFTNGSHRFFERIRGKRGCGAVVMVALLEDRDTVLLVREYAAGVDRYELALPKGVLEENEEVFAAANRELKEELGYGARNFTLLKPMSNAPGYMSSNVKSVLMQDLYPEQLIGDEPEPIEVVPWKLSQMHALLAREDFTEARSIATLFLVKEFLNQS